MNLPNFRFPATDLRPYSAIFAVRVPDSARELTAPGSAFPFDWTDRSIPGFSGYPAILIAVAESPRRAARLVEQSRIVNHRVFADDLHCRPRCDDPDPRLRAMADAGLFQHCAAIFVIPFLINDNSPVVRYNRAGRATLIGHLYIEGGVKTVNYLLVPAGETVFRPAVDPV